MRSKLARRLYSQRVLHTFEQSAQVFHLDCASHDRLAMLKVLVWRLHLPVQWHVQDDEFHVGGGQA